MRICCANKGAVRLRVTRDRTRTRYGRGVGRRARGAGGGAEPEGGARGGCNTEKTFFSTINTSTNRAFSISLSSDSYAGCHIVHSSSSHAKPRPRAPPAPVRFLGVIRCSESLGGTQRGPQLRRDMGARWSDMGARRSEMGRCEARRSEMALPAGLPSGSAAAHAQAQMAAKRQPSELG